MWPLVYACVCVQRRTIKIPVSAERGEEVKLSAANKVIRLQRRVSERVVVGDCGGAISARIFGRRAYRWSNSFSL